MGDRDAGGASGSVAEVARIARAMLAEIADDESELTASAATRHRLEGAAIALEVVSDERRGVPPEPPR